MPYNKEIHYQSGLSLVELMISMVVGLFLLAGVVTNFIGTKNADVKRDAVSEIDANAAVAFNVLRQAISHAGYASIENIHLKDNKPFYTESDGVLQNPKCSNGMLRDKKPPVRRNRTRDNGSKDYLSVMYLADNPCKKGVGSCTNNPANFNPHALMYTDCTGGGSQRDARSVACSTDRVGGMPNKQEALIYNSFYLNNADGGFYCEGSRSSQEEPQPIISNVEAVQYLYGVQTDTNTKIYRTATEVENDNQWGMVTSVQVGLLLRSSKKYVLDKPSDKKVYYLLKEKITIDDSDLRRLFRVYTTTINLENKNSGALL